MEISLAGKTAWITGGSEGIGLAIARQLAQCGARVALTARDESELNEAADKIRADGGDVLTAAADVSKPAQMEAAVRKIVGHWGQLDTVVANAGMNGTWAPIDELTFDEWSQTVAVNLHGTFLTVHHSVPHLKAHGGGSITIISSVNGTRMFSNEGASAYAATKAAQLSVGKMLALELARWKIRVNIVCPGAFNTDIHEKTEREDLKTIDIPVEFPEGNIPLTGGEMGDPVQVANLVTFLASDAASHITGTPIWIDGGQSLLQG